MKLPVDACLDVMQYMLEQYKQATDEDVTFATLNATIKFAVTMPDGLVFEVKIQKEAAEEEQEDEE